MFNQFIGQAGAIRVLTLFTNEYKATGRPVRSFLIASGRGGTGKSSLVKELAESCDLPMEVLNGSDTTPEQLMAVLRSGKFVNGGYIFLDEWNRPNPKLDNALRLVLLDRKLVINGVSYTVSEKTTFVVATNNKSAISQQLKTRLEPNIILKEYNSEELYQLTLGKADIINTKYHRNVITDEIAREVSSRSRLTPRTAENIISMLERLYLSINQTSITLEAAKSLMDDMGFYEGGLNELDVQIMELLSRGPKSLSALKNGLIEDEDTVRESEGYLLRMSLIDIDTKRRLTALGSAALKRLGRG